MNSKHRSHGAWLRALSAGFVAAVAVYGGCNPGEKLYHVKGQAKFNGQPIPKGTIYFDPDESKGNKSGQGFASITSGEYDSSKAGLGISGGAYNVRVQGFDGKAGNEAPFGQPLFLEYVTQKDLPQQDSEYNIDVPRGSK